MKKLIFAFLFSFCFIPNVFAEDMTIIYNSPSSQYLTQLKSDITNSSALTHAYDFISNHTDNDNPYYYIHIKCLSTDSDFLCSNNSFIVEVVYFSSVSSPDFYISSDYSTLYYTFRFNNSNVDSSHNILFRFDDSGLIFSTYSGYYDYQLINQNGFPLYDSNYPFFYSDIDYTFEFTGYYNDSFILRPNSSVPFLKNILSFDSFSDYESSANYQTINLDNYEYIILSLKNYNQTQSFQTNLEVLGQIGITPVYNYGQSSKDSITGSKVQDRCNVNYSSYTSYPLYILQSDLQNNSVYYIKSCISGSSFKFDSSIFDITYITSSNYDNPSITISGRTYDIIPFQDLPSSANQNESDNYIPGESGSALDTGGVDSAIKNVQQSLSSIWNTITYFTSLVGLLFSSLPNELRVVLYSSFVITITIGIIKFFIK